MEAWFNSLDLFQKIYWGIALIASLIFLIMLVGTFLGAGSDDLGDVDAEVDGDTGAGYQFFTFKNLIAFFTIFGWSGIACLDMGYSRPVTILVSLVCGLIMMFIMATLFYYISKLSHSGTLKIQNALNAVGEIYLPVGAKRSKIGKVLIRVQGSLRELEALTDEDTDLATGLVVKVKEITDNGILIVEPLNN